MKKQPQRLSIGLMCLTALAACGKDVQTRAPAPLITAGSSGATTAGRGGASGSSAGGSSGSSSTTPPAPPPVQCGTKQCQPMGQPLMGFTLQEPCCADAAASQCGWAPPGGGACKKPPAVVEACPPLSPIQPGCCIDALNRCGIDGSMYAEGCYNLVESPFAAMMPDLVARTCDGMPVEDLDGGMLDDEDGGEPDDDDDGQAGASGSGGAAAAGSGGASGSGGAGGRSGRGFPGRGFPGRAGNGG